MPRFKSRVIFVDAIRFSDNFPEIKLWLSAFGFGSNSVERAIRIEGYGVTAEPGDWIVVIPD